MNIFRHELKSHLKSVLTWSASIAALIVLFMTLFQSFSSEAAMLDDLMASMPRELLIAFGMTDMNLATVLGYYSLLFVFAQICLAIQAANYGFALVSLEETELTADFLLTRPVTRPRIMTAKLLAACVALLITAAVTWASSYLALALFSGESTYDNGALITLLATVPVLQAVFLALAMAISLLVKRIRSITPLSMALVFGLYILNAFGAMIGEQSLEIISPFKHFAPSRIVATGAWDPLVYISVAAIVISIPLAYALYARRDIRAAV